MFFPSHLHNLKFALNMLNSNKLTKNIKSLKIVNKNTKN